MEVNCPACHQGLRVDDQNVGKQARCPKCGTIFQIVVSATQREKIQTSDSQHVEQNFLAPIESSFAARENPADNSRSTTNSTSNADLHSTANLSQSQTYGAVVVPPPFPTAVTNQLEVKSFAATPQNSFQASSASPVPTAKPSPTRTTEREVLFITDDTPMPVTRAPVNQPVSSAEEWLLRLPNGNEYGPVSRFVLQQWVNERRVVGDHLIRMVSGKWIPARYVFPELREEQQTRLPNKHTQPRFANQSWQGNTRNSQPQAQAYPNNARPQSYSNRPPKQSLAWLSILLGMLGFLIFPLAIIGIVVGANDLNAINRGDLSQEHRANTIFSIVLCAIAITMSFFFLTAILS